MKAGSAVAISGAGQRADHSGNSFGCRSIDADDLCVGIRRTHESQVEHLAQLDVVGKLAPAAQQAILFLARKRFADPVFLVSFGPQLVLLNRASSRSDSRGRLCSREHISSMLSATIDQLLHILLAQRLEQAAGYRRQSAEDLGFTLPRHSWFRYPQA